MLRTKNELPLNVVTLNFSEAVTQIKSRDPELSDILKQLKSKFSSLTFYKAHYHFGDNIIFNGKSYLPLIGSGGLSFCNENLPEEIKKDLAYDSISENPFGLIMQNTAEIFTTNDAGVKSITLLHPGDIFGIPRALDSNNSLRSSVLDLNMNAGSRSLFMLPKISDKAYSDRMQTKFNLKINTPESASDHWQTFRIISNQMKYNWRCEIIYFSREFITQLKSPECALLAMYLTNKHSKSYNAWHSLANIWENIFKAISVENNLNKYTPESLTFVKHLFMLQAGSDFGFAPATNNQTGPIHELQETYRDGYKLSNPVIMVPTSFNYRNTGELPIYTSLNHPITIHQKNSTTANKSQIALLDEIRTLYCIYRKKILTSDNLSDTTLAKILQTSGLSFYHTDPLNYKDVMQSNLIANDDRRFIDKNGENFNSSAPFFRGCIKISKNI